MVFPYVYESTFEAGTVGEWSSEVDTQSKLNVRHYRTLAKHGARLEVPYRGAYCAHVDLSLGTADAYLQEDTGFDVSLNAGLFVRFMLYVQGLTMASADAFTIFTMQSTGPVDEVSVRIQNISGVINLVCAETGATAVGAGTRQTPLVSNEWHLIELGINLDDGVGNDGTIDFFVDGYQVGTQITGLDQAAIIQARFGAIGIDATTTSGHLLFDQIVADDTRVYGFQRFGQAIDLTKSGHLVLGNGQISAALLRPGAGTDCVLRLWDTDTGDTNTRPLLYELRNVTASVPVSESEYFDHAGYFEKGVYAELTGTTPRAQVVLQQAQGLSVGGIKDFAHRRDL